MAPHEIRYDSRSIASGSRHFDQAGRCSGWIELDAERIPIDCFSLRDRTWGPHRPGATRSGDYLWAIASPNAHWHAITGSDEHGIQTIKSGYLVQAGRIGDLVAGERRVLERRRDLPVRVELNAIDEHGRELHAQGEISSVLRWTGWPGRLAYWTLTRWRWNGVEGLGENQEFFPPRGGCSARGRAGCNYVVRAAYQLSERAEGWKTGCAEEGEHVLASVARLKRALTGENADALFVRAPGVEVPDLLDAGHNDGIVNSARQLLIPTIRTSLQRS